MFFEGGKGARTFQEQKKSMRKLFLVEKATQKGAKQRTNEPQMASMMHICGGLVGPKSENVEKT